MSENQKTNEDFVYNVVAYPTFIIPQTHPDRLSAIAKLMGMNPAPAEKCRVLELGCAAGTTLSWMAYNLPESEFIGIDLSENQIDEANKTAKYLELKNVSFFSKDVLEMSEETYGKFDYIIAHGLFSWVPDFVREKILQLYDELLNPNGVGFISYNTFPGIYLRRMAADAMKFHSRRLDNPLEKAQEGLRFVGFLSSQVSNSSVYQATLQYEFEKLAERPLEAIFHNDFAEFNQPFYFMEFVAQAEKHHLQFLSESENFPFQRDTLPAEVNQVFENISENNLEYEQNSDFFYCRRFRQTLLCKKDIVLDTEIHPLKLKDFYISSLVRPTLPTIDLNPDSVKEFVTDEGESFEVGHNLSKLVLSLLVNNGAHLVKLDKLLEKAKEILQSQGIIYEDFEKEAEITASILLQLYSPNAIGLHTVKPNAVELISEKPIANKFALWQLKERNAAVNFHGQTLNFQYEIMQSLFKLLDGTRTREDLLNELAVIINTNEKIENKDELLANLPQVLEQNLFVFAKMGFLVG
jgi:methyltransferase-like protein/SAM-dependent methyltransferase